MPPDTSRDAPANATRPGDLLIESITLGPFETNCYIIAAAQPPANKQTPCWIIDASFEPSELIDRVRALNLKPDALLLTHAHVDHIAGVDEVLRAFPGLKVFIHAAEKDWLSNPVLNLSSPIGIDVTARGPDDLLKEGDTLTLGDTRWQIFHTPGHSPGGITLYHKDSNTAIVGDTLFNGSIGRHDFPGSDFKTLERSIREKLYTLPDNTTIYPGHGPTSTISHEKRTNPFVRA
jgi:hydroxyacylglutathione hydrolase